MNKIVTLVALFTLALFAFGQGDRGPTVVPAYNAGRPAKGVFVPPILPKEALWGPVFKFPYQSHAYDLASRIPGVIYQQPCYCYCDRMGHTSLHSCFESTHAAECGVCLKELYYTYSQSRKWKTPALIRQGIIKGEWKQVELQGADASN